MKVLMQRQSKEDALEEVRKSFVNGMRIGDIFAIYLGDLDVNFTEFSSESIFPTNKIFDFEYAHKHENYINWVKAEEKHGFDGVVNGHFHMSDKFTICIVSTSSDPERIKSIVSKLPNADKLFKFVINA